MRVFSREEEEERLKKEEDEQEKEKMEQETHLRQEEDALKQKQQGLVLYIYIVTHTPRRVEITGCSVACRVCQQLFVRYEVDIIMCVYVVCTCHFEYYIIIFY